MKFTDERFKRGAIRSPWHSIEWGRLWLIICVTGSVASAIINEVAEMRFTHSNAVSVAGTTFQFGLLVACYCFVMLDEWAMAKVAGSVFVAVLIFELATPALCR